MKHLTELKEKPARESGFALFLALSLMAFVLVLVLSLSVLIRVETETSNVGLEQLRAKESARLALMIALGELQKHAGPDQRVTARADILGEGNYDPNAKFWTGVWDTTAPDTDPVWLVSGEQPDPSDTGTSIIQLVGEGSAGSDTTQYVYAPTVELLGSGYTNTTSEIAWWIADEGAKASIALPTNTEDLPDEFFFANSLPHDEQRQILKQLSPRRFATEVFHGADAELIPGDTEDITNTAIQSEVDDANKQLNRIADWSQLPIISGITDLEITDAFHDATYLSKGLFTNTDNGGLQIDLSDKNYTDEDGPLKIDDALKTFIWDSFPDTNGALEIRGLEETALETIEDGDPVQTTPVIITEFALYFVVSGESKSSSTAHAFLRLEAEMWSPYGFRHLFEGDLSSNTPELTIEFENLPDIDLSFYDKDSEAFTNSKTLQFEDISPKFELDFTETHKAGEVRKIIGEWPVNASSDKSNFYYTTLWSWTVDDPSYNKDHRLKTAPDGDYIRYRSNQTTVDLTVKNQDGEIIQQIRNIPYGSIDTDFSYYEDTPSGLSASDAPIVFQYRIYDDRESLEAWYTELDIRSISLDLGTTEAFEQIDVIDQDGDEHGDVDLSDKSMFSNIDFFHGQANNNFYRLYDTFAVPTFSIGALQHLQIKSQPPFSIGNPWGNTYNELFDRYFISTIPQDPEASYWSPSNARNAKLPNPFISIIANDKGGMPSTNDLVGTESAQHLKRIGSFNFNSTSQLAWQSLIESNTLYDWSYALNKGTSSEENFTRLNLESSFFRLPYSGHIRSKAFTDWEFPFELYEEELVDEDDYPSLTNEEKELTFKDASPGVPSKDWQPSASIGHREIPSNEAKSLATEIVDLLIARGRPFPSFKEFLNSGLIQEAIDKTTINTIDSNQTYTDATEDLRIPKNAPAFLSQADIISSISPVLSPRGDTFRIRAGARDISKINGQVTSKIYCEALVQRFPDRVDGDENLIMSNADGFGRKFIILDLQWLDSSQL